MFLCLNFTNIQSSLSHYTNDISETESSDSSDGFSDSDGEIQTQMEELVSGIIKDSKKSL